MLLFLGGSYLRDSMVLVWYVTTLKFPPNDPNVWQIHRALGIDLGGLTPHVWLPSVELFGCQARSKNTTL